ncbi:hypothetical protein PybrP1_005508, partial [[Pythium] brassicae (nom. inval.)]
MRLEATPEYERRVRALRRRLALDFRPLKDTLAKGLDVLVDPEAAVYCTASVEAFCDALFSIIVKSVHEEAAAGVAPLDTKVTVSHIQVALRSHEDFAQLLARVEGAALVLEFFLDDATSRALYERELLATPDAKHLRGGSRSTAGDSGASDDELIRLHERTRAEWQKREDDPFTEVDFATVLKCAHPAFTLAYNATALLSALVRELLNGVCDLAQVEAVQRRAPPELCLEDVEAPLARIFHVGATGAQIARTAHDCLERFRLRSRKGSTLTIRFRVFFSGPAQPPQNPPLALSNVPRETPFAQLLLHMCKKCHVDAAAMAPVYRGRQVEPQSTPATLSMPTGGVVFLVAKKWWDHTRRNEARRGLLSSLRPQDAQLKSLVQSTESKVKKELQTQTTGGFPPDHHPYGLKAPPPAAIAPRREDRPEPPRRAKQQQQQLERSNNASSTSSLHGANPGLRRAGKGRKPSESESEDPSQSPSPLPSSTTTSGDDDSLSLLLKQRERSDVELPPRQLRDEPQPSSVYASVVLDNNRSEDALSEMQQRHALPRTGSSLAHQSSASVDSCGGAPPSSSAAAVAESLAARNAQLMSTLDAAWLGFAAISGGARSMGAKLSTWRGGTEPCGRHRSQEEGGGNEASADTELSAAELTELEAELLARLEKTDELVAQTLAAKQLMTQLVEQVQQHPQRRRERRSQMEAQFFLHEGFFGALGSFLGQFY